MNKLRKCIKNNQRTRIELMLSLIVLCILIPSVVLTYIYISPYIERTYEVEFNEIFTIDSFQVTAFNITDNSYSDYTFSSTDFNNSYKITNLEIGFMNIRENFNDNDISEAYLYNNSTQSSLNTYIQSGNYFLRVFNLNQFNNMSILKEQTMMFKISPKYHLFVISILIESNIEGLEFHQYFHIFFNKNIDNNGFKYKITLYELTTNIEKLQFENQLYHIIATIHNEIYNSRFFDFSFR